MKTLKTIIIILVCSASLATAQDSLYRSKLGLEVSYSRNRFNYQSSYAAFVYSKGRHQVFAGPGMYYLESPSIQPTPLPSALAGYRFFVNGTAQRFSLFFGYDLNVTKGKYKTSYRSYLYESSEYSIVNRTLDYTAIDNFFTCGVKWRFLGRCYLAGQAGAGIGLYRENFAFRTNFSNWSGQGPLAFRYPFGFNTFTKFTLGCDLIRWKKKS
jgi:hypothetical protein